MPRGKTWPCMQVDINREQCIEAFRLCNSHLTSRNAIAKVLEQWGSDDRIFVCLTVRSAFDLVLRAMSWQPGDEIVFSGLNIPQMYQIAEHHGLNTVPVDLDSTSAYWNDDDLAGAISPRTKAVVLAHLFGARRSIESSVAIAHQRGALVIEDCAQAYAGPAWHGDSAADVSLFSFGPLKSATAFGGAIAVIRNPDLADRMRHEFQKDPVQPVSNYRQRIVKYAAIKWLSQPRQYATATMVLRGLKVDTSKVIDRMTRNVPHNELIPTIRQRPCAAVVEMIANRLADGDAPVKQRRAAAEALLQHIAPDKVIPTRHETEHGFWLIPLICKNPSFVRKQLLEGGFDALYPRLKALAPEGQPVTTALRNLESSLALPFSARMQPDELERLGSLVNLHG